LARKLEVWDWCLFSPHWDQYMVFLGNGIVNEFCRMSFVAMSISVLLDPLHLGVTGSGSRYHIWSDPMFA
jgi:hypothetical protein